MSKTTSLKLLLLVKFVFWVCLFSSVSMASIGNTQPVVLIYRFDVFEPPDRIKESGLVLALWGNGDIVWSEHTIKGGPPLKVGNIGKTAIDKLLADIKVNHDLQALLGRKYMVLDDEYAIIRIHSSDLNIRCVSAHEVLELDANAVALSYGLQTLNGKLREEMLRQDEPAFIEYRKAWERMRKSIQTVIPPDGKLYGKKINIRLR